MTPDLERFWDTLQRMVMPKTTATLMQCWDALKVLGGTYDPTLTDRSRLRGFLDQLRTGGCIHLPSERNPAMWNRDGSPTLPESIRFTRKRSIVPDDSWATRSWHEVTACLATLPGASRYAVDIVQMEKFLRNGGMHRPIVPINERSAEVFGNEKRLSLLRRTILFQSGKIDVIQHLRCRLVPPPIPWERGSGSGNPLIVENATTYWSLCRWNRIHANWRAVIYGCGNQITGQIETLADLAQEEHWNCYRYFGDLDPQGVEIPTSISGSLACHDLAIVPDDGLYQLLLDCHASWKQQRPSKPERLSMAACKWLGSLVVPIRKLIESGSYAPQELVGVDALSAWPPS